MANRFNQINDFISYATTFAAMAKELNIDNEAIQHICALDTDFTQVVESLSAIFSRAETTPAETQQIEITPEICEESYDSASEAVMTETTPKTNEAPVEDHVEEAPVPEPVGATWKSHPDLEGVELSTDGHIRINGVEAVPRMVGGYVKFYDPNTRKYYALASAVLTTFEGRTDNSMCPYYKDGNKDNCKLENLRWATRDSSLTTSQIERACKLIAENPKLNENEMLNMLVREHTIKSVTALRSILAGNWRSISDRYFTVRGGSIIPVLAPTVKVSDNCEDGGNLKGILSLTRDTEFVRKLYMEKVENNDASSEDLVALILSYIMDGKDTAGEIQKAIRKDFGRKVMVSNRDILRVIG